MSVWILLGRREDRVYDLLVSRAPAQYTVHGFTDLFPCRVWIPSKKRFGGQQESWCAVAALKGSLFNEGLVESGCVSVVKQPLDSYYLSAIEFLGQHETGLDRSAVDKDEAESAVTTPTARLNALKLELISEHFEKSGVGGNLDGSMSIVDDEFDSPHHLRPPRSSLRANLVNTSIR